MEVYIEYVIIDNVVIDYLLLKAAFTVIGKRYGKGRLFLCSVLGAGAALIFPLLNFNAVLTAAIKIIVGFGLTLFAAKYKNIKEYVFVTAVFLLFTFISGGFVTAVYELFGISFSEEISIGLVILPVYICVKVCVETVKNIYKRRSVLRSVVDAEIIACGKTLKVKGLIDTGNALYYKGLPVIIANRDVGENFISPNVKIETYYFDTASGEGKMFLIKTDKIKIFYDGKENIYNNVMLGITKKDVGTGYDVILHPSLSEVKNECVESVEKTS